jgi:hypothetical protein
LSFSTYLSKIEKALAAGNATEHTHRPALKELLESFKPKITATNEPKREEFGAPDYVISEQHGHGPLTIGYVEAKDVGLSLDEVQQSDQLKRYRQYLPNLILTDYLDFRWFVDGKLRRAACLARLGLGGKLKHDKKGAEEVEQLLRAFLDHEPAKIAKPQELAARMARLTHMIRDIIIDAIKTGKAYGTLTDLRNAFAQALIPDLDLPQKTAEFADMYAQTIAYGLFAARCNHRSSTPFRRLGAATEIPKTNPFLRKLFDTITGADLDGEPYAGFVDDLADLLQHADMAAVLREFGKRTRHKDPVFHFYETFLTAYDPKLREKRGVYYTPEQVVSYIVRSVDHQLKNRLDCPEGLADTSTCQFERPSDGDDAKTETSPRVLILDPACGTGTFLYAVVDHIRKQFMKTGNAGMWSGYVRNHLLPRLFGFELLIAPYAVAHFKLGMQLSGYDLSDEQRKNWTYDFAGGVEDRLRIYLTNTLEGIDRAIPDLFGWYRIISDEANAAREIKRDLPIMVVLGNPPYSRESYNRGAWIENLMEEYKQTVKAQESQIQALSNDYIKFLRFAQWRLDQTGRGVLAMITGHGYLDGPQARDMRRSLMRSYNEIYVLNLHGSVRRDSAATHAKRDDPVFEIQQGTAIIVACKINDKEACQVFQYDLVGSLDEKFEFLNSNDFSTVTWNELTPHSPNFFFADFASKDGTVDVETEYYSYPEIPTFFGTGQRQYDKERYWATGFASQQDQFAITFTDAELKRNIHKLISAKSEDEAREQFRLCSTNQWNYDRARDELATGDWESHRANCAYRPFDTRRTAFDRNIVSILRTNVMSQLLGVDNIALVVSRVVNDARFAHVFVARQPVDKIFLSSKTSTNAYVFPIYSYPTAGGEDEKLSRSEILRRFRQVRIPNLASSFVETFADRLGLAFIVSGTGDLELTLGPDDIMHYIYGMLHSPAYRERYDKFLKTDFPRVPLTNDKELFRRLCKLGSELVTLHLLESPQLASSNFITRYSVPGDNLVEKGHPKYLAPDEPEPGTGKPLAEGRVYINTDKPREKKHGQYFEGIPPEVWEFYVGGYQVCEKWLKDRRGRTLSYDDLTHYQKVVLALKETISLMNEIDAAIPSWPSATFRNAG